MKNKEKQEIRDILLKLKQHEEVISQLVTMVGWTNHYLIKMNAGQEDNAR
ncbi:hypothetical protein ACFFIS_03975 [Virgibacillus soli]|uniref:Uncharacterized protein n=1 Tax=Paracerasibacillus soli TaxID=480284 RepID=A0ABU5CRE1_9BACI|nr:hypothetical protein [Virgibacillus soli]MDY0408909.1 hypothetical protein [Virgibacillus soli]